MLRRVRAIRIYGDREPVRVSLEGRVRLAVAVLREHDPVGDDGHARIELVFADGHGVVLNDIRVLGALDTEEAMERGCCRLRGRHTANCEHGRSGQQTASRQAVRYR